MCKQLYQTLEDRSNIEDIKNNGPFICKREDAWLGEGYYYWETFLENAHLWGKKIYKKNDKNYIICLSKINYNNKVYDLEDSSTLYEFNKLNEKLSEIYPKKNITVPVVLEQLKQSMEFTSKYKAIRARTTNDMNCPTEKILFKKNHRAYLNTCPHIQVCILEKNFIGENNFKVIFPTEYCEDYTI